MEFDIPRVLPEPWRYSPASPAPSYYSAASTPYSPTSTAHLLSLSSLEDACPPDSPPSFTFPDARSCHRYAVRALDYFNMRDDANFQLHDAGLSNVMVLGDGTWIHCNFTASIPNWTTPRHFFAEIMAETMTVTFCVILEGCNTTTGCGFCKEIIHPTHGFLRGSKLDTIDSKLERKKYPDSDTSAAFPCEDKPAPFQDKLSEVNSIYAKLALECYNKQNGTNFDLVDALLYRALSIWEGKWLHCNFTAKPPNVDSLPKLFFAEMHYVARNKTWAIEACLILEGKTTDGCNHCRGVVHPANGFMKGNHKNARKGLPPVINCSLPETDKWRRRAEIALEYHNQANHTDYEVEKIFAKMAFLVSPDGTFKSASNQNIDETWYHFNFSAWHSEDGKYTTRMFFAEMVGVFSKHNACMMETLEVTACSILEPKMIFSLQSCVCSAVMHPTDGFIKRLLPKFDLSMFPNPLMSTRATPSRARMFNAQPPTGKELEIRQLNLGRAKIAMEYYNQKNGTDYKLHFGSGSSELLSDGSRWLHCNFTAIVPPDYELKHFFAEMHVDSPNQYTVTACLILEDCETTDGCNACRDSKVKHPTHGFLQGLPKYDSTPSSSPS